MIEAADEVRKLKNTSDVAECGVSVDGTYGHSSLNGCVAVLSIDTDKVLFRSDVEMVQKLSVSVEAESWKYNDMGLIRVPVNGKNKYPSESTINIH
ncbi:hypothetical protein TNCV_458811 [Trichonephila clavipes]|nr:hypothetical protein TNCV_458811 [Trichonephila clavipes]